MFHSDFYELFFKNKVSVFNSTSFNHPNVVISAQSKNARLKMVNDFVLLLFSFHKCFKFVTSYLEQI